MSKLYNQIYFLQGDWLALKNYCDNKSNHPQGFPVSHKFFEDIRKVIHLLTVIFAGQIDDSPATYPFSPPGSYEPPDGIYKYIGDWVVVTDDPNFGKLFWKNKSHIWASTAPSTPAPPANIHPDDNEWITDTATWQLCANPNFYYQHNVNAPIKMIFSDQIVSEGEIINQFTTNLPAHNWLPRQVDPKEQFKPLVYADTGDVGWQYREKVFIDDHLIITRDLGPVFDCWRYGAGPYSNGKYTIQCKDPYGFLIGSIKSLIGNQYANRGGYEFNTPDDISASDCWTANPKVKGGSYQAAIEVILSQEYLSQKATDEYNERWMALNHPTSEEPPETFDDYDEYPSVNDECWGYNESGFELLKFLSGKYDYMFSYGDGSYPYWPTVIVEQITDWDVNEVKTKAQSFIDYSLDLIGTFRVTWMYSLGRPSIWMRSKEMGAPIRDDWTGEVAGRNNATWFSNRRNTYPAVNEFDTHFAEIESADGKTAVIDGDITDSLKHGYTIHLCSVPTQLIVGDGDVSYGYVLSAKYDSGTGKTTVISTVEFGEYAYIAYNPNISERHDPKLIYYDKNGELKLHYKLMPELILEMGELIWPTIFQKVAATLTTYFGEFFGDAGDGYPTIGAYIADYMGQALAAFHREVEAGKDANGNGWSEGYGWLGSKVTGSVDSGDNFEPPYSIGPTEEQAVGFFCHAFKINWDSSLKGLPDKVLVRMKWLDQVQSYHSNGDPVYYPQEVADAQSQVVTSGAKCRYKYLEGKTDGSLYFLDPKIVPSPYAGPSAANHAFFGFARFLDLAFRLFNGTVAVELNWENVPESVFDRCLIDHIDLPTTPQADTKPPRPNPPVWHDDAYSYFKLVAPCGGDKITDYTVWLGGEGVLEGEYKLHNGDLYRATCNVVNTTVPPGSNYAEYKWIPPTFELRVAGVSCLCEDHEGSVPLKYRMVCDDDGELTSEYLTSRSADVFCDEIEMTEIPLYEVVVEDNGSGFMRILCDSSGFEIDDKVLFKQCDLYREINTVTAKGEGYVDFDIGYYGIAFGVNAVMYNLTKIYDETSWNADLVSGYNFSLQAKDSSTPTNNETSLSVRKNPIIPAEWPGYIFETGRFSLPWL
jgi:hypothetical protein